MPRQKREHTPEAQEERSLAKRWQILSAKQGHSMHVSRFIKTLRKTGTTSSKQSLGGARNDIIGQNVDDIIAWVTSHGGKLPRQRSLDREERTLAVSHRDLNARCNGRMRTGTRPSEQKLNDYEVAYFALIAAKFVSPDVRASAVGSSDTEQPDTIAHITAAG